MSDTWSKYEDKIRSLFPGVTGEQAEDLLWCCTAFPFNGIDNAMKQLEEMSERSGRNFSKAMEIAHKDVEEAMKQVWENESNVDRTNIDPSEKPL